MTPRQRFVPTRGYLVSATRFDAIAARDPGATRATLRARGILIQGEDLQDVREILRSLRASVDETPKPH